MAVETQDSATPAQVSLWNDPRARAIATQILVVVLVLGFFFYIGNNIATTTPPQQHRLTEPSSIRPA